MTEYPCAGCPAAQKKSCNYQRCPRFREWFAAVWTEIRAAGEQRKEEAEQDV